MEDKEKKALQSALAEIRSRPPVGRRRRPHDFSSVVRTLFREISQLREEGYTMISIFEKLAEHGFFKETKDPKHFRQAFNRERERRRKLGDTRKGKTTIRGGTVPPEPGGNARADLGPSGVRRNSDGTFDFD